MSYRCCCPTKNGETRCYSVGDCSVCPTGAPENCECFFDDCAQAHAIDSVVSSPFGDNPEITAAVTVVNESVYDVERLMKTSELGLRILDYNSAFTEDADGILGEHPELGRRIFQVLMKAVSFGREMELERIAPGSTSPARRFTEEDYRFGADVADEIRNVTGNDALLQAIDDVQRKAEQFVGLSPAEALGVFYRPLNED